MISLLIIWSKLLVSTTNAGEFKILDLNELSLDFKFYQSGSRNLLIYPDVPKEGMNIDIKIDVLKFMYLDSQILTLTSGNQFKGAGLETRFGMRVTPWLETGIWHRSAHVLDGTHSFMPYPTEDSLQVKIYLFRKQQRESMFK